MKPVRPNKRKEVEAKYGKGIREILLDFWDAYPNQTVLGEKLEVSGSTISDWINVSNLARKTILIDKEPETRRQSRLAEIETQYQRPIRDVLLQFIDQGLDDAGIASELNVSLQTVSHYFTRSHLPGRQSRNREIARIEQEYEQPLPEILKSLYDQLGSQTIVAKTLDVDPTTVSGWLIRFGLSEKVILVESRGRKELPSRKRRVT